MSKPSFFAELKRRNVLRAGVLYAGAVWALAQGISQLSPAVGLPDWATRWFLIAAIIGFPFWLAFAWFYEFTPQGWKRESEVAADASITRSTGRKLDRAIIAVLAVAVVLLLANTFVWRKGAGLEGEPASAIPAKSVAVLPFENLSDDKSNAYFASGMQDEILTRLANIRDLKVISRTSTEQYASHPPNLKVVGQQLGVAAVLEGSVQKAAGKVRINLQLIDARNDTHLWAQNYDRDLADVFAVQSEVAQQVATALQTQLVPSESARIAQAPTTNMHAHDLYLQARFEFNQLQVSSVPDPVAIGRDAVKQFGDAIAADPDFALAYAALSYLQCYLHWYGVDTSPELVAQARANAQKALALQPGLAEAHLAMGYVYYWGSRDYANALTEFAAARAASPNSAEAIAGIGFVKRRQGDATLGVPELEAANQLDPRNSLLLREIANSYTMQRRYGEDDAMYARSLAVFPGDTEARVQHATSLMMRGDTAAAAREMAEVPPGIDPQGSMSLARFRLQMLLRNADAALAALAHAPDWLMTRFEHSLVPVASLRAQALALKGDADGARVQFLRAQAQLQDALKNPVTANDATSLLGIVYAGLGRKHDALDAARLAFERLPLSRDPMVGAYNLDRLARVEASVGELDAAIGHLRQLLAAPAGTVIAAPIMRIDPAWDALRKQPGFQALLKETP